MRQIYDEGYRRGHADGQQTARPARDWTPTNGSSAEAGADAKRVETILAAAAQSEAAGLLAEFEIEFTQSMRDRLKKYGKRTFISEKQWGVIDRLENKLMRQGYID